MKKLLLLSAVFLFVYAGLFSQTTDTIRVNYNGFIFEDNVNATVDSQPGWRMNLNDSCGTHRWGYMDFSLDKVPESAQKIELKIYLEAEGININDFNLGENVVFVDLYGAKYSFNKTLTWENKTEPTDENEFKYPTKRLTEQNRSSWLVWDVTDFIKSQNGKGYAYFRLEGGVQGRKLILKTRQMHVSAETDKYGMYYPRLIQTKICTAVNNPNAKASFCVYPTMADNTIWIKGDSNQTNIYNSMCILVLTMKHDTTDKIINVSSLPKGIYFVRNGNSAAKFIKE